MVNNQVSDPRYRSDDWPPFWVSNKGFPHIFVLVDTHCNSSLIFLVPEYSPVAERPRASPTTTPRLMSSGDNSNTPANKPSTTDKIGLLLSVSPTLFATSTNPRINGPISIP